MQPEKQPTQQNNNQQRKNNQRTNLTRFGQRAYVLGVREREIFIDSTINTNNYKRILEGGKQFLLGIFRDTIHEASSPYL